MRATRVASVLLSLAVVLALTAACGGGGSGAGTSSPGGSSAGDYKEIDSPEGLKAALERDNPGADWLGDITDVTLETYLGAPVFVIHTGWKLIGQTDPAVFDEANRKQQAISEALGAYDSFKPAPNVALLNGDKTLTPLYSSGGKTMAEALALPPAPTTPEEMKAWLAKVYGPGGLVKLGPDEDWYDAINSISVDTGSGGTRLVVTTSLPSWNGDVRASLIEMALATTGSPLLENYWISAKDGSGAAGSSGVMEPGSGGFQYP
jgi:hypothetical protein